MHLLVIGQMETGACRSISCAGCLVTFLLYTYKVAFPITIGLQGKHNEIFLEITCLHVLSILVPIEIFRLSNISYLVWLSKLHD